MRTRHSVIYQCSSCGSVIHSQLQSEPPYCCGQEMVNVEVASEGSVANESTGHENEALWPPFNEHLGIGIPRAASIRHRTVGVTEAIYGRRSVRDYTDQPVSNPTVMALIKSACQAPSAINVQPWAFVVIQDKVLLKHYSDRGKSLAAKSMDLAAAPGNVKQMLGDPEYNIFYNAGTLIVIFAKPLGQHPDWDCCLAAQNLMLTAHGLGLGTCPIGFAWPLLDQGDVKQALNVAPDYVAVLPIIVGYPHSEPPATERRDPEILCWK